MTVRRKEKEKWTKCTDQHQMKVESFVFPDVVSDARQQDRVVKPKHNIRQINK